MLNCAVMLCKQMQTVFTGKNSLWTSRYAKQNSLFLRNIFPQTSSTAELSPYLFPCTNKRTLDYRIAPRCVTRTFLIAILFHLFLCLIRVSNFVSVTIWEKNQGVCLKNEMTQYGPFVFSVAILQIKPFTNQRVKSFRQKMALVQKKTNCEIEVTFCLYY